MINKKAWESGYFGPAEKGGGGDMVFSNLLYPNIKSHSMVEGGLLNNSRIAAERRGRKLI